jgi:hypothetical protein
MPLSDRAKTYLVVSAVVVVAGGNVLFGLSRTTEPGPAGAPATATVGTADAAATSVQPSPVATVNAAPKTGTNNVSAAAQPREAVAPSAREEAPSRCDVAACAAAYHSFKESDCMYQPNNGPRRLCTKGKPPH